VLGAVVGLGAGSVLYAVVTWYRNDLVPGAAFLLAIATTLGRLLGVEVTLLVFTPAAIRGPAVFAVGAVFGLPIAILESALFFAIVVAIGRKYRGHFAPGTGPHSASPPAPGGRSAA
jgi:hypothetical protein